MASRYASKTDVPVDRSRSEIERVLRMHGASAFHYGWDDRRAAIMFELADRRILFKLDMPDRKERRFTHTASRGYKRSPEAVDAEYDQATRALWRALLLVIKAKLDGGS